jgi:hypothetical protein
MRPLIRILLKHGVSHAEFCELAKLLYVDVADTEFLLEGRKQSTSRVSVLTGLNRKEVTRVKKILETNIYHEPVSQNRASRVISGWLQDERFQTSEGKTADLPIEGDEGSFSQLIKIYSGDMPVRSVLDELLRVGSVEKMANGTIHLCSKAYVPQHSTEEKLRLMGIGTADLLTTLDHNLESTLKDSRLQLTMSYENLPKEIIPQFKKLSEKESYSLLTMLDKWLAEYDRDITPNVEGTGHYRAGIGIYYFEEDLSGKIFETPLELDTLPDKE